MSHFEFFVLSQFEFLSFVTIRVFEFFDETQNPNCDETKKKLKL